MIGCVKVFNQKSDYFLAPFKKLLMNSNHKIRRDCQCQTLVKEYFCYFERKAMLEGPSAYKIAKRTFSFF